MINGKFEAKDFPKQWGLTEDQQKQIADRANELLTKYLEGCPVVYGEMMKRGPLKGEVWDWHDDACHSGTDTHRARLICVERIEG